MRDFTTEYNRLRGTDFQRRSCLEKELTGEDRQGTEKWPEVLLVSSQGSMVVERKTIVWPSNFLHAHSKRHYMTDQLTSRLSESCRLPLTVSVNSSQFSGCKDSDLKEIAAEVVAQIESGRTAGTVSFGRDRIQWSCRAGLTYAPEGVRVEVLDCESDGPDTFESIESLRRARAEQVGGFRRRLELELQDVAKKFHRYSDHRRILLVQFVGDSSALTEEDDLSEILTPVAEASFLDETWIATKRWISEDDFRIRWVPWE